MFYLIISGFLGFGFNFNLTLLIIARLPIMSFRRLQLLSSECVFLCVRERKRKRESRVGTSWIKYIGVLYISVGA